MMKPRRCLIGLAAVTVLASWIGASGPDGSPAGPPSVLCPSIEASDHDRAIERAFEDVLDREPTEGELHRYRELMEDEHWNERDVREDLRDRAEARRSRRRGARARTARRRDGGGRCLAAVLAAVRVVGAGGGRARRKP